MKNKFFAMAMIAVTVGTSLVSCTKNEDPTSPLKPKATEFTNVTVDLKAEGQNSTTGKSVHRGDGLYAWITEIDVTVHSDDFSYADNMTPFMLTSQAVGTTYLNSLVEGSYNLENVALGSNDFTIVTKTNTPSIVSFETTTQTVADRLSAHKGKNPYAIYNASIVNQNVVAGANVLSPTTLNTINGRAVGIFQLSQALKDLGVTARISASTSFLVNGSIAPIVVSSANIGSFYASSTTTVAGTTATFTVQLLDIHGNVFATLNPTTMTIAASTSTNTVYTIDKTGITSNTELDTFTAQQWVDNDGTGTIN